MNPPSTPYPVLAHAFRVCPIQIKKFMENPCFFQAEPGLVDLEFDNALYVPRVLN